MNNKIEKVKVQLDDHTTRWLEFFKPNAAEVDENNNLELLCRYGCSYYKICPLLRDPMHLDDKEYCFIDFCQSLGVDSEGNRTDFADMCPVEGTIETNLGDIDDIFQDIIDRDPLVKVSDIIEKVCKGEDSELNFSCYNEGHTNCKYTNDMCILKSLFPKNKVK